MSAVRWTSRQVGRSPLFGDIRSELSRVGFETQSDTDNEAISSD